MEENSKTEQEREIFRKLDALKVAVIKLAAIRSHPSRVVLDLYKAWRKEDLS